jgi:hypothetical protein
MYYKGGTHTPDQSLIFLKRALAVNIRELNLSSKDFKLELIESDVGDVNQWRALRLSIDGINDSDGQIRFKVEMKKALAALKKPDIETVKPFKECQLCRKPGTGVF